ncbi:MAG: hypothetical protein ABR924_21135 [Terracidiphilus sp.]|jgi:hypothetical protein
MHYYRTQKDIAGLAREIPEFKYRAQIGDFIPKKHEGFIEIGLLTSVLKDAVWFGRGDAGRKDHQCRVSDTVMDFIMNAGLFDDAVNKRNLVKVFGRSEKGRLVDIVAYNMHNLIDPTDLKS